MLVVAAVAALCAAALFGLSSVLMARVARAAPSADVLRLRLLTRLFRSREWLVGAALQPLSFCIQAVALALGPLALVQPLAATDLLFALPIQARISRRPMRPVEWLGSALVVAGIAGFLLISPPRPGLSVPSPGGWVAVGTLVGGGVLVAAASAVRTSGTARTTLLAAAGAGAFALVDVLSKATVDELRLHGLAQVLTSGYPYALLAVGIAGLVLSQSAFQSGPLHVSLPVIDTLEPTLAVLVGALAFHEALAASPLELTAQLAAGALALAGIVLLDRTNRP